MAHTSDCNCPPCRYRRGEDLGQAPRLSVRLRADVREFLLGHDEGARGLIERLVDQERAGRGKRPRESPQREDAWARVRELEKQLEVVQAQLAPKLDPVPSPAKQPSSDKSSGSRLDNYAARFREGFQKNYRAGIVARRLGVKSQPQMEALQLGYCGTRGVARDALEQRELKKLGLTELNGRAMS